MVLLGMVPMLMHTPPTDISFSMTPTRFPALAPWMAARCPPGPEPITIKSYGCMQGILRCQVARDDSGFDGHARGSIDDFFAAHDRPASLPRPFIFVRAAMAPYCFIMVRICRYCLRTVLTSWTVVPLPLAMRLRRLPSMTLWSRRSWLVMALMIPSTGVSWPPP